MNLKKVIKERIKRISYESQLSDNELVSERNVHCLGVFGVWTKSHIMLDYRIFANRGFGDFDRLSVTSRILGEI